MKLQNELRAVQQKQMAMLEARKMIMSPREKEVEKTYQQSESITTHEAETSN